MSDRSKKILIVDDEPNMRIALFEALTRNGYEVLVAENGRMALEMVERRKPDLVITDLKMPEIDGLELVAGLKEMDPNLPVVVITGYGTVETAVQAMKLGVVDYVMKPFSVEVIEATVARVFSSAEAEPRCNQIGLARRGETTIERPIIGNDEKLLRLLKRAKSVASSKATVLVLGESGTGKELVARFIHNESERRNMPFVAVNCAALPEGLLESELFGHEKGAFTGAIATKKGKFELADRGTILLDEIGEIPLSLQAKLLRVLQEEVVDRVGGRSPIKIDVHVVATTNKNLEKAVQDGAFRQDLYYRLNVIPLVLPPLRERQVDIPPLAQYFLQKYCTFYNKAIQGISPGAKERLLRHPWQGNVREMENLFERAVLLCEGTSLDVSDFWDEEFPSGTVVQTVRPEGEFGSLEDMERQMILQALHKTDNNRTHAAKLLGVSVRTLRNKLHEYRIKGFIE